MKKAKTPEWTKNVKWECYDDVAKRSKAKKQTKKDKK